MVNKKHIFIPVIVICVMILVMGVVLSGCTGNEENKKPSDLIKDAYGDKAYTISFSSDTLDAPLADIEYTANKIVKIPTPQKVGYIFEGWFFDKDYIMPYSDEALLLLMQDVTLYPKWSKEKFVHNGTYDIEFQTTILDETVKKGAITDQFGGYADFGEALIKDDCHIEKSDEDLLLKLQFDTRTVIPFDAAGKVFDVAVNDKMNSEIYITNTIDSLSEPIKTVFIKINSMDLSKPLYLDITWINFENEDLTDETRYDTLTKYQIELEFTKIIGFSEAFADVNSQLSEGYYLAKSYFRKEDNGESMGSTFNPVYSYIYSDGNRHYKLIKQNMPYLGMVSAEKPLLQPLQDNFYNPLVSFVSTIMAFDVDIKDKSKITQSEYYPKTYNGGYYHRTVTEYHSDTNRFYNIIDLDPDLTKEYIALTAISGYMERESGMGYIRQILSIDYDNLIKVPDCDYKPLKGNCFEYEDAFNFYPGDYKDLNQKDLTYDAIVKYGMSIEMPNFFYSAPSIKSELKDKTIYSSSFEVIPTAQTNANKVQDSRGIIGEFATNTRVYGYDQHEPLFVDRMCPQAFEGNGYNSMLRDVREIQIGRSCLMGEIVNIESLYKEKVNNDVDFNNVKYKAYELATNNPIFIEGNQLQFKMDMAIEFTYNDKQGTRTTIVELKNIKDPKVSSVHDICNWEIGPNGHYVKDTVDKVGERILYPRVTYNWGEVERQIVGEFYGENHGMSIDPTKAMIFNLDEGYKKLDLSLSHQSDFVLKNKNVMLMYEMNNEFNERSYIYFDYINNPKPSYVIKDTDGTVLIDKDVKFRDKDHSRIDINEVVTRGVIYDKFDSSHFKSYTHTENGVTEDYQFVYYNINSNVESKLGCLPSNVEDMVNEVNNFLSDKAFGSVTQVYRHGVDYLTINYLYNVTFDGEEKFSSLNNEVYFTNIKYLIKKNALIGSNREKISTFRINVEKYIDGRPSNVYEDVFDRTIEDEGHQYAITFKAPGTYKLTITYYVDTSIMGDKSSSQEKYIFSQMMTVKSNVSDIKIIYKTDRYHPFKGGATEREFTYNLSSMITLMPFNKNYFDLAMFNKDDTIFPYNRSADNLYGWSTTTNLSGYIFNPNQRISGRDFISMFNTDKVVLNAIWENKFKVELDANGYKRTTTARIDNIFDSYKIELPTVSSPSGYQFIGWSGGFLGSSIVLAKETYLPYQPDYYDKEKYPDSYFKLKAVYRKISDDSTTTKPKNSNIDSINNIEKVDTAIIKPTKEGDDLCYLN